MKEFFEQFSPPGAENVFLVFVVITALLLGFAGVAGIMGETQHRSHLEEMNYSRDLLRRGYIQGCTRDDISAANNKDCEELSLVLYPVLTEEQ